jgi:putative ABC transport system permease protein
MKRRSRAAGWLFSLALLAYPRAFRRRFGAEMRADSQGEGTLFNVVLSGLAERVTAIEHVIWFPSHRPYLYTMDERPTMFRDSIRNDVRFAIRQALKSPFFTAVAVLALALGIGATMAIFTVVNGVLLRPLPYSDPEHLAMVWSDARAEGRPQNVVSPANFEDYRRMNRTFAAMEYTLSFLVSPVIQGQEQSGRVPMLRTSEGMLQLLGREAALGRTYRPGDRDVAVISHGFWQRQMGGDPAIIGRTFTFSGNERLTIVGVMPPDFTFPYRSMFGPWASGRAETADIWVPMPFEGWRWVDKGGQLLRTQHSLAVVGRLAPGVSIDEARADMATVARQLEQAHPESNTGWGATVVPLLEQTVGDVRPAWLLLLAGVGVLLLMAAVNVANLLLARSLSRQRELAVRASLGATRWRLAQQALIESLLLSFAGAALGLLVMRWGVQGLVYLAPPEMPRMAGLSPDWRVLLVTIVVAVITGSAIGVLPAVMAGKADVRSTLNDHSRGAVGSMRRRRARTALVVVEIALAVVLAVSVALLVQSFSRLLGVDPGFRASQLLTFQMNVPDRLTTPDARRAFYEEWLDRLEAIPGVTAVGGTTRIPLGSTRVTTSVQVEGLDVPRGELPEAEFRRSMRDYFQAMNIPVVRGRLFTAEDGPTAPSVALINQVLARRLFGTGDPIGRHVRTGPDPSGPWTTIVGVVGDIRHTSLDAEPLPELYLNYASNPPNSPFLVVRTTGPATDIAEHVRREARDLDPSMSIFDVRAMEDVRAESVADRRFVLVLMSGFGLLALVLAGLGVYGVMSLTVAERTSEVGLRLALGARPGQVRAMVIREALRVAGLGAVIGVVLALAVAPLLGSQLFGVAPHDPIALVAAPALLMLAAVLAALVPATRAMAVDPAESLRA